MKNQHDDFYPQYHFSRIWSMVGNTQMRIGQTATEFRDIFVLFYQSPTTIILYFETESKYWDLLTDDSSLPTTDYPRFSGQPMQSSDDTKQIKPVHFCLPELKGFEIDTMWSGKYCIHLVLTKGQVNPIKYKPPESQTRLQYLEESARLRRKIKFENTLFPPPPSPPPPLCEIYH